MKIYSSILAFSALASSTALVNAEKAITPQASKSSSTVYQRMLSKKQIEEVPVYWGRWNFAYTDALFDHKKALGKIDSGYTGRVIMDIDFAKKHKIKLKEAGTIHGGAGKMKRFKGLVSSVKVAGKEMRSFYKPHKISTTGLGHTSKGGELAQDRSIDLHVGVNLLREHGWLLSYKEKKAWRQRADISSTLKQAGYLRVPMTKSARGLQIIDLKLANLPVKVALDTGAGASHFLPEIVEKAKLVKAGAGKISTGDGASASAKAVIVRKVPLEIAGRKFTIGSCWSSNAAKVVQRQGKDVKNVQAVVGVDLLMGLGAMIDFKNDVLWLPPMTTSQ